MTTPNRHAGNLARIFNRLDALAYEQLCAEAARLAEENERLRDALSWAEQAAESWRDDALRAMDDLRVQTGARPGLTQSGRLVSIPAGAH